MIKNICSQELEDLLQKMPVGNLRENANQGPFMDEKRLTMANDPTDASNGDASSTAVEEGEIVEEGDTEEEAPAGLVSEIRGDTVINDDNKRKKKERYDRWVKEKEDKKLSRKAAKM